MKWSLSTNWLSRRVESGEEIAEKASAMGFDELELGFHTTVEQAAGFRRKIDLIRIGSVHAFCPVPISAPQGHPELYSLASFDEDARALARFHVRKNIEFAGSIGADTVVLHAGRVSFSTFLRRGFDSGTLRAALSSAKGDLTDKRYAKLLARARLMNMRQAFFASRHSTSLFSIVEISSLCILKRSNNSLSSLMYISVPMFCF